MRKHKKNPNRVPLGDTSVDTAAIINEASLGMMFRAWAGLLGALADDTSVTADDMFDLWERVNDQAKKIHGYFSVTAWQKKLRELTGHSLPFSELSTISIRTEGDLKRFKAKAKQNAICAAYAVIASVILQDEILEALRMAVFLKKAFSLEEEIQEDRISTSDIVEMLRDEYRLSLFSTKTGAELRKL